VNSSGLEYSDELVSFGIVTDGTSPANLESVIDSILKQQVSKPEILVIGAISAYNSISPHHQSNIEFLEFDENQKKGWITKKKNLLTERASGRYIVFMHDYVTLHEDWFTFVTQYLNYRDFDVAITEVLDYSGNRYFDWVLHPLNYFITDIFSFPNHLLLPYEVDSLQRLQYVPGYYFIAKKEFMQKYPLDENRVWGEGEDVEWSFRWRNEKAKYRFIPKASASLIKKKETSACEIGQRKVLLLRVLTNPLIFFIHKRIHFDVRRIRRIFGLPDAI